MSALRLPGPDGRTRLVIDEGWPEVRARHFRIGSSSGPILYGSFPTGTSEMDRKRKQNRAWRKEHGHPERKRQSIEARPRVKAGPLCGKAMTLGRTCARGPGHGLPHKSREAMDVERDRKTPSRP